jgi:hypothetical protein
MPPRNRTVKPNRAVVRDPSEILFGRDLRGLGDRCAGRSGKLEGKEEVNLDTWVQRDLVMPSSTPGHLALPELAENVQVRGQLLPRTKKGGPIDWPLRLFPPLPACRSLLSRRPPSWLLSTSRGIPLRLGATSSLTELLHALDF